MGLQRTFPHPPSISVITPVLNPNIEYLTAAYESLKIQDREDWEWLLQGDGETDFNDLPDEIKTDDRVKIVPGHGVRFGTAATRNLALTRSEGELVMLLDADDELMISALSALAQPHADPDIVFSFGRFEWISNIGAERAPGAKKPIPEGIVPRHGIWAWQKAYGEFPLASASVMIKAVDLIRIGGFPAWATGEDSVALFLLNDLGPGYCVDQFVYRYRRHENQKTEQDWYLALRWQRVMFQNRLARLQQGIARDRSR